MEWGGWKQGKRMAEHQVSLPWLKIAVESVAASFRLLPMSELELEQFHVTGARDP